VAGDLSPGMIYVSPLHLIRDICGPMRFLLEAMRNLIGAIRNS
jgi:hypothetical protein